MDENALIAQEEGRSTSELTNLEVRDYLVQDVCVDQNGAVTRINPSNCAGDGRTLRDLKVNEYLPYHKYDRQGLQVSDSFPRYNYQNTLRYIRTLDNAYDYDWQRGVYRSSPLEMSYGENDLPVDGHNTDEAEGNIVSIVGTRDDTGAQLWSKDRDGTYQDAWSLFEKDDLSSTPEQHQTNICMFRAESEESQRSWLEERDWSRCSNVGRSNARWVEGAVTYSSGEQLMSIVVDHWGGDRGIRFGGTERFYYTREYGLTRWESYQAKGWSLWLPDNDDPSDEELQEAYREGYRSSEAACPGIRDERDGKPVWGCREWTNIVKSEAPTGDPPFVWPTLPVFSKGNLLFNADFGWRTTEKWFIRGTGDVESRLDQVLQTVQNKKSYNNHVVLRCRADSDCEEARIQQVQRRDKSRLAAGDKLVFGARLWGRGQVKVVVRQEDKDGTVSRRKEKTVNLTQSARWTQDSVVVHGAAERFLFSVVIVSDTAEVRIDDTFLTPVND